MVAVHPSSATPQPTIVPNPVSNIRKRHFFLYLFNCSKKQHNKPKCFFAYWQIPFRRKFNCLDIFIIGGLLRIRRTMSYILLLPTYCEWTMSFDTPLNCSVHSIFRKLCSQPTTINLLAEITPGFGLEVKGKGRIENGGSFYSTTEWATVMIVFSL